VVLSFDTPSSGNVRRSMAGLEVTVSVHV
jgi:hypothetical protein